MSFPSFGPSTTAEEVAAVFCDVIRGKNGRSTFLFLFLFLTLSTSQSLSQELRSIALGLRQRERLHNMRVWSSSLGTTLSGGWSLALASRASTSDKARLRLSESAIRLEFPSANVRCLNLDLSSLAAVRRAAKEVNGYSEPIHVGLSYLQTTL